VVVESGRSFFFRYWGKATAKFPRRLTRGRSCPAYGRHEVLGDFGESSLAPCHCVTLLQYASIGARCSLLYSAFSGAFLLLHMCLVGAESTALFPTDCEMDAGTSRTARTSV